MTRCIMSGMAFAQTTVPLQGAALLEAVADVMQGASVRALRRRHPALSKADCNALARWAVPLLDAFAGADAGGGSRGPDVGERSFSGVGGIAGAADAQAPAEEKVIPAHQPEPPAEDQKKDVAPPAPVEDAFEDVPAEFRTPELAAVYRTTLAREMGARA